MKTALTIAGSDPTGGAGLQADLKVFHHFGVYGLSAVSALTAQNTTEVNSVMGVDAGFLERQLDTLINDIRPDALKTGMLFSIEAIRTVARIVRSFDLQNLVIDPVTVSSTGASLLEDGALDVLIEELFPLAAVITPNIYEASVLSGVRIENEIEMEEAAMKLRRLGPVTVVVTGGHLENETMELVWDGVSAHLFRGKKVAGEYHGTGCAFSAAVTALLAKGEPVLGSVRKAGEFIEKAIRNAHDLGKGMRLLHV
jgi:hydroxymethylpyrimidine/phosphomethylpyrimidine kinase